MNVGTVYNDLIIHLYREITAHGMNIRLICTFVTCMQMIHSFSLNNPWFQLALPLLVLLYNVINDSRVLCVSLKYSL